MRTPVSGNRPILVTGGAGFIGANFILDWLADPLASPVVNLDKLTYAANPATLAGVAQDPRYTFAQGDVGDATSVRHLLAEHKPRAILHFAAESHVDRSIHAPDTFLRTNVEGTFVLLEAARAYHATLCSDARESFRLLHVSTDEVYGTLNPADLPFSERTPYAPRSPYAASKAASDHLVHAWHHTYGLPTVVTNCSNNYGRFQFPEKLIPLMVTYALQGKPLPVYGDGLQVRDWLYVGDHTRALRTILADGKPGEMYNIGGGNQRSNLEVVTAICALLDELLPGSAFCPHARLITHVEDRLGHDRRYAIDASKLERELGWRATETFASGLRRTVRWYLEHAPWVESVTNGAYRQWEQINYGDRKDLAATQAKADQAKAGA